MCVMADVGRTRRCHRGRVRLLWDTKDDRAFARFQHQPQTRGSAGAFQQQAADLVGRRVCEDDKQAGSEPSGGFMGARGGRMEAHLLSRSPACVINERSPQTCRGVGGAEDSQRPQKGPEREKNEVRLLPGRKIQLRVTLLLGGSRPNGPGVGLFCLLAGARC